MASEILNLLILSDFLYYYFKSRFDTRVSAKVGAQPGDIVLKGMDVV